MAHTRHQFVDALLSDDMFKSLIPLFIKESVTEGNQDHDEGFTRFLTAWLENSCEQGFRLITTKSESPLERVFLGALMLGFVKWSPTGLVWTPTFQEDAPTVLEAYRRDHAQAIQLVQDYTARTKSEHPVADLLARAISADSPFEQSDLLARHLAEELFATWDTYHLTLQPRFTKIRVDGRSIRADALVWIPSDPQFNVVLECDGYDYHADKPRFTTDRRRDRILASHGYQIMRFSGQEVFENPIATATEAFDFLDAQREQRSKTGPRDATS